MAEERLNVFPSRMELMTIKDRIKAAWTGYSLLKRKSDAIKLKLNAILREVLEAKREFCPKVREAAYAHTQAVYAAGDFNAGVLQSVKKSTFRVEASENNVAGVKVPDFFRKPMEKGADAESLLGISQGGAEVTKCQEMYTSTLDGLIRVASLQAQLKILDEQLKVTNRRVNALEFVIVPKLDNTITYIKQELEEMEREDKNRIAKVKAIRELQDIAEKMAMEMAKSSEDTPSILGPKDSSMDIVDAFD